MRKPGLDISLSDGQKFTAETAEYDDYLENTNEPKVVSTSVISGFQGRQQSNFTADIMQQPQGCFAKQCKSSQPRMHWCGCLCLCSSWLFCSWLFGGLPEGRTVSFPPSLFSSCTHHGIADSEIWITLCASL